MKEYMYEYLHMAVSAMSINHQYFPLGLYGKCMVIFWIYFYLSGLSHNILPESKPWPGHEAISSDNLNPWSSVDELRNYDACLTLLALSKNRSTMRETCGTER